MLVPEREAYYQRTSNEMNIFARPFDELLDDREDADQTKHKPKWK